MELLEAYGMHNSFSLLSCYLTLRSYIHTLNSKALLRTPGVYIMEIQRIFLLLHIVSFHSAQVSCFLKDISILALITVLFLFVPL